MTHRLARLTERRDYYSEGATTDRPISFDPRRVTIVIADDESSASDPPGAWVHMSLASEWEAPADWATRKSGADNVFLSREPYADALREIDMALRGATARVASVGLDAPVHTIEFSARVRHAFGRHGIVTLHDLCNRSAAELADMPNFGATCLREVRERLAVVGLALRGEECR